MESFNRKTCELPGLESVWVEYQTRGYPRKLRREWDAAGPDEVLEIILRYIQAWNLLDLNGLALEVTEVRENYRERITLSQRKNDTSLPLAERRKAAQDYEAFYDALGNVEDSLIVWLIRSFQQFWIYELTQPRKKSSPPSTIISSETAALPQNS